jgi:hypothetical protein
MKTFTLQIVLSLFVVWTAAAICPPETPDLKPPIPPVGYTDTVHACTCDTLGFNCRWVWVGVNTNTAVQSAPASLLGIVAQGSGVGATTQQATEAQTELLRQQAEALKIENAARRNQLEQQGLLPHQETRDEKADRRFHGRLSEARTRHSDFDSAIARQDFNPTPTMQRAMFKSRVAGELAYWLATHPQESQRIAALPPDSAQRALSKIEATLR